MPCDKNCEMIYQWLEPGKLCAGRQKGGTTLVVPWLGLCTFTAGAAGSIPIRGTNIPCTLGEKKKKDRKEKVRGKKEDGIWEIKIMLAPCKVHEVIKGKVHTVETQNQPRSCTGCSSGLKCVWVYTLGDSENVIGIGVIGIGILRRWLLRYREIVQRVVDACRRNNWELWMFNKPSFLRLSIYDL